MLRLVKNVLSDPMVYTYIFWGKLYRQGLLKRYARLAAKGGISRLYFILSLDCDTDEDIRVVWDVHRRLTSLNIKPVYAVPGKLLERGKDVYRRISETGAEFINHGYEEHTYFNQSAGRYASCFFYDQLPLEVVRDDVLKGDRALRDILNVNVKGFRAPHFGTFQKFYQMRFLHSVLKELDYKYSTSSEPYYGFRYGPVFERFGVKEIPVSGMWSYPLSVLDTWGFFAAPERTFSEADYFREGKTVVDFLIKTNSVGVLNYYADPSHIANNEGFFIAVEEWAKAGCSLSYSSLLEELSGEKT